MTVKALAVLLVAAAVAFGARAHGDPTPAPAACHGHVLRVYQPAGRWPNIARHARDAIAGRDETHRRWPRVLRINREGAAGRRSVAVAVLPTRAGMDRDEYPPAAGRASAPADVRYVPSAENEAAGASLGAQLRGHKDGECFMYVYSSRPGEPR